MPDPTETPTLPILDYRQKRADPPFISPGKIGAGIVLATNALGIVIAASLLAHVSDTRGWDQFALTILIEVVGLLQLAVTVASTLICVRSASLPRWLRWTLFISMLVGLIISSISFIVSQTL